jgi:hypothetical protein
MSVAFGKSCAALAWTGNLSWKVWKSLLISGTQACTKTGLSQLKAALIEKFA